LESYHPYLLPQEVSKGPTTLGTYASLPRNGKGRFGFLSPLGVNEFLNNMAFTMAYRNFKKSLKMAFSPLGVYGMPKTLFSSPQTLLSCNFLKLFPHILLIVFTIGDANYINL
jgi:hypothetical protein